MSELKDKLKEILEDKGSIVKKIFLSATDAFVDTKLFKLLIVFLFYFFAYDLIKNLFIFFDITSPIVTQMYLSWLFLILLLWALLPQRKSYL